MRRLSQRHSLTLVEELSCENIVLRDTRTERNTPPAVSEAKEISKSAGLLYVTDEEPGITRSRRGSGFRYFDSDGKPITDARVLERIRALAIPPAYKEVWICKHPRGHVQATARDARGRKQYRYHVDWREVRDNAKFERMLEFGAALPRLRRQLRTDLGVPGLPRDKVLAVVITLLDRTRIRVGNEEYARTNKSFGLTTLRNRHAKFLREGRALLRFRGKGGVQHEVRINDKRLSDIVHQCQELPGQHLFQYLGDDGQHHPIDSTLVNEYLHLVMGQEFTAKDFRTWNATLRAIDLLFATPLPERASERACKKCILEAVRQVAVELRNTPAVCRKSYINPCVFTAWQDGRLHRLLRRKTFRRPLDREKAALLFIKAVIGN